MRLAYLTVCLAFSAVVAAQSVPAAIYTDPPADRAHPASMTVLHIPTHGVLINGVIYTPPGAGVHPTFVLCHGLPGNEKNLDLAQAVRRAGWNAVTFNYRGSWGSPGSFSFAHNLEDTQAVLAYLRNPANAQRLGIDVNRIVLAGHSMGGWVTVLTAARDHALLGAVLFSAADMGASARRSRQRLVAEMQDNMETLAGTTPQKMADELLAHGSGWTFSTAIPGLSHTRLLVLTANDGLAPVNDALVKALRANGNDLITAIHADTDHPWSDHRIFLESAVIEWLAKLPADPAN